MPDRGADAGCDERRERAQPLARRRRARLGRAPHVVVERRHREGDRDVRARRRLGEQLGVADDHRPAGDDREWLPRVAEDLDAGAREPVAALGGLVRIGRGADRDRLTAPRRPRELAAQHLGDVHLDADRGPVAVVGGAVGPLFERPDVTEGAAVHAAHIRVQRPVERHSLHPVQRGPARLFAVLRPPRAQHRTYVRVVAPTDILRRLI